MMESIFLDTVNFISTNRMWIMPIVLLIVSSALVYQFYSIFKKIAEEME